MRPLYLVLVPLLWAGAIAMGVAWGRWEILIAALAIHILEVPLAGMPVGRRAGYPRRRSIAMTMVFGVTWWGPLRRLERNPPIHEI